ncbi:hypothetical protein CR162_17280 [Pseudoroseomonas rhizosphaerae]|uniref:Uncharacterized protein n=1 Tax=Teichococcus rhizosphaerae TaxID=1335062 RepID=A0A2C7A111_9PROT|nr:hypothetical protein [Pseudoroseomonas rhizosphaerae]PHK93738.1 hypothetical protein CR162_17280 [Pseudoroseomonas rhizosphaerae]
MPLPSTPRFVAPHFIETEGCSDMAGPVQRACAFTTAVPGWPRNAGGASHHHRCTLFSGTGRWKEGEPMRWRTESWPLSSRGPGGLLPPAAEPLVMEGQAPGLMQAIALALGAAYNPPFATEGGAEPVRCVAPAFVEMRREAGLPRIWACSHLNTLEPSSAAQPWTHLQTIFIREWPGREARARFQCELESLPFGTVIPAQAVAAPRAPRWWAATLEEAMGGALEALYGTAPAAHRLKPGLGGRGKGAA